MKDSPVQKNISILISCLLLGQMAFTSLFAQPVITIKMVKVDSSWAGNSVNAVIFRKNSVITYKGVQFISFYNQQGYVILGKRKSGTKKWQFRNTTYKGNIADAHNAISIMVDGEGYLHLSWDHHNNPLNYSKSLQPLSLELTEKLSMTGKSESRVSYPEFYRMRNGNLLFFYRDGSSGQGNLVLNEYDVKSRRWVQVQNNLLDGEGQRNAYWQACVDELGTIHLSWVWRETPDVASNHDLCYARSTDAGRTWEKSTGEKYQVPVNAAKAEYAFRIPQKSELINQTSMCADANGIPYIATYWRETLSTVPQFQIVYINRTKWEKQNPGFRTIPFTLSGGGTKKIPISRPLVICWQTKQRTSVAVIFRDEERGSKVSVLIAKDIAKNKWKVRDLTDRNLGSWEPSYDSELWREKKILHLFIQKVAQVDAEGKANLPPQMVEVLEAKPSQWVK